MSENSIEISIIIPTYNMEKTLSKTLDSLDRLDFDRHKFEVIIVDDGSTDGSTEIAREWVESTKLNAAHHLRDRSQGYGPGIARNDGLEIAKGQVVAFTDADCIVHKDWLSELRKAVFDEGHAMVAGKTECDEVLLFPWKVAPAGMVGIGANLAFDRSKTGEPLCSTQLNDHTGNEVDVILTMEDKGFELKYVPSMIIIHPASRFSLHTVASRALSRSNEVYMYKKYGQRFSEAIHPLFKPALFGRISPSALFLIAFIMLSVLLLSYSFIGGITILTGVLLLFSLSFLAHYYQYCITYKPDASAHVTMKERLKTLMMVIIYPFLLVAARIIGSVKFRSLMI